MMVITSRFVMTDADAKVARARAAKTETKRVVDTTRIRVVLKTIYITPSEW